VIMKYTEPGHDSEVRIAAVRALASIMRGRSDALDLFSSLLESPDLRVRLTAIVELGRLSDPRAIPRLAALAERDLNRRLGRFIAEAIRQIDAGIGSPPRQNEREPARRRRGAHARR
jgi:HEAT repeat protein